MHEYLLFSQIPRARYEQVTNILTGVSGAGPVEYSEQHLIYHPLKTPEIKTSKKNPKLTPAPTQQRPSIQHIIRDLRTLNTEGRSNGQGETAAEGIIDSSTWTLRTAEIPEPGIPSVISRAASEIKIQPDDIQRLQDPSAIKYAGTHVISGDRFVHNNVIVCVYRAYMAPAVPASEDSALDPLSSAPPDSETLRPVDISGAYVVEACVRVEDNGDSKLLEKAREELLGFKRMMEGAIDLRVPDRLALDTRMKVN